MTRLKATLVIGALFFGMNSFAAITQEKALIICGANQNWDSSEDRALWTAYTNLDKELPVSGTFYYSSDDKKANTYSNINVSAPKVNILKEPNREGLSARYGVYACVSVTANVTTYDCTVLSVDPATGEKKRDCK